MEIACEVRFQPNLGFGKVVPRVQGKTIDRVGIVSAQINEYRGQSRIKELKWFKVRGSAFHRQILSMKNASYLFNILLNYGTKVGLFKGLNIRTIIQLTGEL